MSALQAPPDQGTVQVGYEIANALGQLNASRPKLGAHCVEAVPVARAIRLILNALHLHMVSTGKSPQEIARDIRKGRIEVRFSGNRATVMVP